MLDDLEQNQRLSNGKGGLFTTLGVSTGLANTNPIATGASTTFLGWGLASVPVQKPSPLKVILEGLSDPVFVLLSGHGALIAEATIEKGRSKPAGQIVLFKKIMEDWGFQEQEAAILMGLEAASDVRDIYDGRKPVGNRDANDRLRAILRIAADLDALSLARA